MTEARDRLRAQLVRHEGTILHAYQDSLGYWTIGTGRLIDARRGGGITTSEADYLLDGDIDRIVKGLLARHPWVLDLDAVRQAVLVNMAFQLGLAGLATFQRTLTAIEQGRYGAAADHMLASKWAKQTKGRATELAAQMKTGAYQV